MIFPGELHEYFTADASYPLQHKSMITMSRTPLTTCHWSQVTRHWCRLRHGLTCVQSDQVSLLRSSVVMIPTAGRLGNSMSTLAMIIGLQRLGFTPVIDLANYQILSDTFTNIASSGVQVLEEFFCDPTTVNWEHFNQPLDQLNTSQLSRGKAVIFWISGVSVHESVHGFARLVTPITEKIRETFTFREDIQSLAEQRLSDIVDDYLMKVNKNRKRKISARSLNIVGVHIRRTDHVQHEKQFGYRSLDRHYFSQAMDLIRDSVKHPVFVMVTDDQDWVITQFPKQRFQYYTTGQCYNLILQHNTCES